MANDLAEHNIRAYKRLQHGVGSHRGHVLSTDGPAHAATKFLGGSMDLERALDAGNRL
jgi:hypothetical protein